MRLFAGDDWAVDHHDVELMDERGRVLARTRLPEGGSRERHGVSGAKSDTGDARMLRTDSRQLRGGGRQPGRGAVKVVARTRKTLIWERTRQAPAAAPPAAGVLPRPAGGLR